MEIVAPAGEMDSLKAAITAGTDSVYLGLKGYGARRMAVNFSKLELLKVIDYAHLRGVRLYLTLNSLLTDHEVERLYPVVKDLYEKGLDGIIIQDLGLYRFLKTHFPKFEFHASTQMTVANHVEANFMKEIGMSRLVPARELSFPELTSLKKKSNIELEVFVSGSICISFSGNCYLSSFIGGRSGNRGVCTQACRRFYEDEKGNEGFFLSPKDQFMSKTELEQLSQIGIDCIKIEGRMKNAAYVYSAVKHFHESMLGEDSNSLTHKLFNRGYSKGFFYGGKDIMNTAYSANIGYSLGKLKDNQLLLTDRVVLGDGISYLDEKKNVLKGEYINKIIVQGFQGTKTSAEKGEKIIFSKIPEGTKYIHKTYSKELNDSIERKFATEKKYLSVSGKLIARIGKPLQLILSLGKLVVSVTGDTLSSAQQRVLTAQEIREKVSEMGESTFQLETLELDYDEKCFIPLKSLKTIKRDAMQKLSKKILDTQQRTALPLIPTTFTNRFNPDPDFAVCVTHPWQEKVARDNGIQRVYYKGVDAAREGLLDKIDLENPLVRNLYQLLRNHNDKVTLDWNFNITNSYAFAEYSQLEKVHTIYLSPELSFDQLKDIRGDKCRKGFVIYGHLIGMYIEPDIFKEDYKEIVNDSHDKFRVVKNQLGNSELYHYKPMNLIPKLKKVLELGYDELRLDFQFETEQEMIRILKSLKTLSGSYFPYNFEHGLI